MPQEVSLVRYAADGTPAPVGMDNPIQVMFGDSVSVDGFNRLRTSDPISTFDSSFEYDLQPILWEPFTAGSSSITHNFNTTSADMTVTTASGDRAIMQTREYFRYQPGKSHGSSKSFVLGASDANRVQYVMYGDEDNAVFFRDNGGILEFGIRSNVSGSPVENVVSQDAWNVDGFGDAGNTRNPSGHTIDPTKGLIVFIDLQWLSLGRVRMGFDIEGHIHYAHYFTHANEISVPFMRTANLPVRYEIHNTGVCSAGTTMKAICCAVISEGGRDTNFTFGFSAGNGITEVAVASGQRYQCVSIRPKLLFNSHTNRMQIDLKEFGVFAQDGAAYVEVIYGGTLSGTPTWTDVNTAHSGMEYTVTAATTVTGGIRIGESHVAAGGLGSGSFSTSVQESASARLPISLDISGAHPTSPLTDIISIVVQPQTATTTNVAGHITWNEVR